MKVIFLALAFPKMDKTKYLYTQLIAQFDEKGHDVIVVAPAFDENGVGLQTEAGIKVLRVKTLPLFGVGLIKKGIANILLPYQYKNALKKHNIGLNFDLILTPTPPITLYGVASWLKRKSKAKLYLILRDIFPQNAVDLGMLNKNSIVHYYFRKKEKKLYAKADHIGCMSQGNIDYVKKHNLSVSPSKLHMLSNWGDMVPLVSEKKINAFRKKENLDGKFVIIFGGNIGLPQKMENIIALATACRNQEDFVFFIFGNGNEKLNLQKLVNENSIQNVQLRDGLPQKDYMKWVQMADIGLISLSEKFTIPNIPSKVLSYYNTKTPVLASIDVNTDFGDILEKLNTGLWAEAGQTNKLKEKLMRLYNNPDLRKEMGENGYQYMQRYLTSEEALNIVLRETGLA